MIKQSTIKMTGDNARININSTDNSINVSADFSSEQLHKFIKQVRSVLSQLPESSHKIIEHQLVIIEKEANKTKPEKLSVYSALQSIKSIAETASGNIAATTIINMIGS